MSDVFMGLVAEGSAVDLALRGFNCEAVLASTGVDIGRNSERIRAQTKGIDRIQYGSAHVRLRLGPTVIDEAAQRFREGEPHARILQRLGLSVDANRAPGRLRAVFRALGVDAKRKDFAPITIFTGLFDEGTAQDLACRGYNRDAVLDLTGVDLGGYRSSARDGIRGVDLLEYVTAHVSERVAPSAVDSLLAEYGQRRRFREDLLDALGVGSTNSGLTLKNLFDGLGRGTQFETARLEAHATQLHLAQVRAHTPEANAKRTASRRARSNDPVLRFHDVEKQKATMRRKYGVDSPLQSPVIRERYVATMRRRYGVDHHNQRPERRTAMRIAATPERLARMQAGKDYSQEANKRFGERMRRWWSNSENAEHAFSVKRENGTWRDSQPERDLGDLLAEHFGIDDVEQQYSDPLRYPWSCDFYVRSRDLFIELNGSWTHGFHWFDAKDADDAATVKKWASKGGPYYHNAIVNWTQRDVDKRRTARKHSLNYAVFWGDHALDDARIWIADCAPDREDWK